MRKKILIVDDQPSIAKIISIFLSGDFEIVYFPNPIQAIQWLREGNLPSLIITDLHMPEMSGEDFLGFLKKNEFFKEIPIVILSAEESSAVKIRTLENGANDYILKPFNPQELKVRISKVL